jgi:hypothetical protein
MRIFANLLALCLTPTVAADVFLQFGEGMVMWRGGYAVSLGNGSWAGSGWSQFPGVNPPWNPIAGPAPAFTLERLPLNGSAMCAQPEVFVPPPTPQVPVLRTHRMFVAGETVTFTLAE